MKNNKLFILALVVIAAVFLWAIAPSNENTVAGKPVDEIVDLSKYSKGDPTAKVKIEQYSDFLCPSCGTVSMTVMPEIVDKYVNTGEAYYVFYVLNLGFNANSSQKLAEASMCMADQDKFWDFHDNAYRFVYNDYLAKGISPYDITINDDEPKSLAIAAQANAESFNNCYDDRSKKNQIYSMTNAAKESGVTGTPYFKVNGTPIKGVPDYNVLETAIKANL